VTDEVRIESYFFYADDLPRGRPVTHRITRCIECGASIKQIGD
jgi:hypothetical protein